MRSQAFCLSRVIKSVFGLIHLQAMILVLLDETETWEEYEWKWEDLKSMGYSRISTKRPAEFVREGCQWYAITCECTSDIKQYGGLPVPLFRSSHVMAYFSHEFFKWLTADMGR
jgi:hypothetical protein